MNYIITKAIENGTIISGLIAFLVIGGAVAMAVTGQVVPDWLTMSVSLIIGYFFGSSTAPKQFRQDDANRIQRALYETLPPHTKLEDMNKEFKQKQSRH
jgi:hypothetical protein